MRLPRPVRLDLQSGDAEVQKWKLAETRRCFCSTLSPCSASGNLFIFKKHLPSVSIQAWAVYKGKYREGKDKADPTMWKTRLRCALNKSTDFQEVPERNQLDITEPYKVYRIQRDGGSRPAGEARSGTDSEQSSRLVFGSHRSSRVHSSDSVLIKEPGRIQAKESLSLPVRGTLTLSILLFCMMCV